MLTLLTKYNYDIYFERSLIMTTGFADKAQNTDFLGMDREYEGITNFITCCETPMTIAINGDWGAGKSSAMYIIQEKLREKYALPHNEDSISIDSLIINFNTWEFSIFGENDKLVLELMKTLNDRLDRICKKKNTEEGKFNFKDLRSALQYLLRKTPSGLTRATVGIVEESELVKSVINFLQGMSENRNDISDENAPSVSYSDTDIARAIKENIDQKIQYILSNIDQRLPKRMYIFIDDLDRLEPRVALELIEGMKNFATYENCVFILAVDQKVIERGLKSKYGNDFNDEMTINFFDKIIQVPFELPMYKYNIKDYICALFTKKNESLAVSDRIAESDIEKRADEFAGLLGAFDEKNPRTIKRSLNLLQLHSCMSGRGSDNEMIFPDIKTYAVLLLMLKSKSDHVRFLEKAAEYSAASSDNISMAVSAFKALGEPREEEQNGNARDTSGYRSAVLNVFFPESGENYDPDISAKELMDILNITQPENSDSFIKASIVVNLYKLFNAAGVSMKYKQGGIFAPNGGVGSLTDLNERLGVYAEYGTGGRLDINWNPAASQSMNFYIILKLNGHGQELKEKIIEARDEKGSPVFMEYERSELFLPENISRYFYKFNDNGSVGIYMNSYTNLKHITELIRITGLK